MKLGGRHLRRDMSEMKKGGMGVKEEPYCIVYIQEVLRNKEKLISRVSSLSPCPFPFHISLSVVSTIEKPSGAHNCAQISCSSRRCPRSACDLLWAHQDGSMKHPV